MNKFFIIGNLVREPEQTQTSSGKLVCRFSVAVTRNYGDKQTDYFNCVAWGSIGENIAKYTQKGSKVSVVGSVEIKNYEDSKGNKRTSVEVNVGEIEFLSKGN